VTCIAHVIRRMRYSSNLTSPDPINSPHSMRTSRKHGRIQCEMCGIAGIFLLANETILDLERKLCVMNTLIAHRGPDEQGI
jgi:hypothetical protein